MIKYSMYLNDGNPTELSANGAGPQSSGIERFDAVTSTWMDLTGLQQGSIPADRSRHGLALVGDELFAFGGMTADGEHAM
jgi:hypothetical protein